MLADETGALSNIPLIEELKQQIEILENLVAEHRSHSSV
jgi:UDP-N-acetylglucosamine enolpyruvyl transferase